MAAWVKEEEKASEQEAEEERRARGGQIEVASGVTVASLRCFRAA